MVDLFKQEKVEKFALDTDGNMTLELRSPYKGNDKYTIRSAISASSITI